MRAFFRKQARYSTVPDDETVLMEDRREMIKALHRKIMAITGEAG